MCYLFHLFPGLPLFSLVFSITGPVGRCVLKAARGSKLPEEVKMQLDRPRKIQAKHIN